MILTSRKIGVINSLLRFQRSTLSTLFFACAALLAGCSQSLPDDEAMIRHFEQHEAEFAQLLAVTDSLEQERLATVGKEACNRRPPFLELPQTELETQRAEMTANLGVKRTTVNALVIGTAFFVAEGAPWFHVAPVYSKKGYVYRPCTPAPGLLLETLDDLKKWASETAYYRHIKGDWYLYTYFSD